MNKNWQIPRRKFLRGLGTIIALPMLDAMLPSMSAFAQTVGNTPGGFPKRLAFVYVPQGKNMEDWTPKTFGENYDLPMILEPLKDHQKDFNLITGLALEQANSMGDGGGDHARASATYLTGCHPKKTAGADIKAGISVDQIAATKIGDQTRLPSLELSCDGGQRAGSCDSGYSCSYQFNLSWLSETQPANPEVNPRAVFDRLFASSNQGETQEAQARRTLLNKSVLDFALDDASRFQKNLGATDRRKLDEYLTAVREIELRVERAEKFHIAVPDGVTAPEMFENYEQQVRLMFDMLALAFQTDSTRVSTFIMAHDGSNRPYPFIGVSDGHHDLSHHRGDEKKKALIAKINRFHTTQLAYFLQKLKSIKEGDGNLLDNSMIVYGSGISDGNKHLHENLPILVAGRGGGSITPGRHLQVDDMTPVTNLYLSLLDRMGAPAERVGDSTGKLEIIS
jgi:uncharacterized protein DUF1552